MKKIFLITQREYLTRVKNKWFLITTFLAPLGIVLLMVVPVWVTRYSNEVQRIAVVDESGYFVNKIPDDKLLYFIQEDAPLDSLKSNLQKSEYSGVLYIPQIDIEKPRGIKFYSNNQLGIKTEIYLKQMLEKEIRKLKIHKAGLNKTILEQLEPDISVENIVLSDEGEKKGNSAIAAVFGYGMGFTIYIVLLIYGTMVMRGVMEEKTSRIVEVMMSSVKPFQLMMGKIVGLGAVGLTQFILWAVLISIANFFLGLYFSEQITELQSMSISSMPAHDKEMEKMAVIFSAVQNLNFPLIVFCFIFYFLGGYILYASLFAAIGSTASEDGDVQSLTFPVTLPIIISIFIMMAAVNEPNSSLAVWASLIPFSSSIVMLGRIPFGIPAWQIILSMVMLVAGFILTTWLAAKIYRTGILLYGKKVTLKEMWKWLLKS